MQAPWEVLTGLKRDLEIEERLERLTDAGVSGSDLVIATIGAGLRPFTRYAAVELPNGEEIPTERFLEEVQARVLGAVLSQVHGLADGVSAIDAATRYYVIARYSFGYADVEFDEANNLARTAGVELRELATGAAPLASVAKGKVRFLDFEARGEDPSTDTEVGEPGWQVDPEPATKPEPLSDHAPILVTLKGTGSIESRSAEPA